MGWRCSRAVETLQKREGGQFLPSALQHKQREVCAKETRKMDG